MEVNLLSNPSVTHTHTATILLNLNPIFLIFLQLIDSYRLFLKKKKKDSFFFRRELSRRIEPSYSKVQIISNSAKKFWMISNGVENKKWDWEKIIILSLGLAIESNSG